MSRLEQAESFVATVEAGSFTAAAKRVGLNKSALSRRVAELEARLGARLLNRSTRSLSLTEEGEVFYARARELLAEWDAAESELAASGGRLEGRVRVSVPLSYGLNRLSPILVDFMDAHPGVSLDIDFSDRKVDLIAEGFDLAVRISERLPDSELRARKLEIIAMMAAASPGFLEHHGTPESVADLAALPEIRYGLRPRSSWRVEDPDGRVRTLDMRPAHTVTNGDFAVRAAIAGQGIVVEPAFIVAEAVERGALVRLLPDHAFPTITAFTVRPPAVGGTARVRALVEHLARGCERAV